MPPCKAHVALKSQGILSSLLSFPQKNQFLAHCQVSAKLASLWWHQILQCSHSPVLLVPHSSPPVQKHPYNFFLPISFIPSISGLLAAQRYHFGRKLTAPSTLLYHVFDTQPTSTQPSYYFQLFLFWLFFFNGTKKQNITDFWSNQFWFCTGSGKTLQGLFCTN